ncbi:MAG: hypothetical protein WDN23_05860 [Edaphobacter sp.]
MNDEQLFSGIAVVVDDEVEDPKSAIGQICAAIKVQGSHVIPLKVAPTEEQIKTLTGISFFVVDWNLDESIREMSEQGVTIPATVARQSVKKTLALLKNLKENRVAPIVVFTSGDIADVKQKIEAAFPDGRHVLVKSKTEVINEGVHKVLGSWVKTSAAAYVLRTWEMEYERAKQSFFKDFYTASAEWPVILWDTFHEDGVPASDELGRLIMRNIQSRMTPFGFDLKGFVKTESDVLLDRTVVLAVLEGERYIKKDSLHEDSISPGDIFKDGNTYYINIRPECDCVARGGASADLIDLYLLRGSKLTKKQQEKTENHLYGRLDERDVEAILFPIHDGKSVSFQFAEIVVKQWGEMKLKRVGRVLPPYLTRLQERFSAYFQRPGLNRYPPVTFQVEATPSPGAKSAEALDGSNANATVAAVSTTEVAAEPEFIPAPGADEANPKDDKATRQETEVEKPK